MTSTCIVSECGAFYIDFGRCTNNTMVVQPGTEACICTTAVIADYKQCYPCLITLPGQTQPPITPDAFVNSCNGKSTVNPYNPGLPSMTSRSSGASPTYSPGGSSSNNGNSTGSNTGLYIGIGCGVAAVVLAIGLFFFWRSRRHNKGKDATVANGASKLDPAHNTGHHHQPLPLPLQQVQQNQFTQHSPPMQQPFQTQYPQSPHQQPFQPQPQFQPQQQLQPQYPQQQYGQQQYQSVSHPPPAAAYYPQPQQQPPGNHYPSVAAVPVPSQPTSSPPFQAANTNPYYDQQQHQAAHQLVTTPPSATTTTTAPIPQENIATVGYDQQQQYSSPPPPPPPPPIPMPMPGQSHAYANMNNNYTIATAIQTASSPATTTLSASNNTATVFEPSPHQTPAATTAHVAPTASVPKPNISQHGPQFYAPEYDKTTQPSGPGNPQYVSTDSTYHQ